MSGAKIEKLARMANQIGDFFAPMAEPAGTQGVATHIRRFWTPKMIRELKSAAEQGHLKLNATASRGLAAIPNEALPDVTAIT